MEIFRTENSYVLLCGESSLWIDKKSGDLEIKPGIFSLLAFIMVCFYSCRKTKCYSPKSYLLSPSSFRIVHSLGTGKRAGSRMHGHFLRLHRPHQGNRYQRFDSARQGKRSRRRTSIWASNPQDKIHCHVGPNC